MNISGIRQEGIHTPFLFSSIGQSMFHETIGFFVLGAPPQQLQQVEL